jgi:multidrug efflux pump subunit AcrA (membrane-fusion protein)
MIQKLLPILAAALLTFAGTHAYLTGRPDPDSPPPLPPPTSPFEHTVAGAGMVEPSTEASGSAAIAVGSQLAGVVTRVSVRIGQEVKAGELLFELDKRQAEATVLVQQAAVVVAQAQLRRLELQPRPEEVPPSEAQVKAAEATLRQLEDQRNRDRRMGPMALAEQDRIAHEQAYRSAFHQYELARANLALLKAGAWLPDREIARANLRLAQVQEKQARVNLELLQVSAPVDGTILQVNVRPGEYVASAPGAGLVVMGNLRPIHVRVNIDQEDLPRLVLEAPARAKMRGEARQETIPLRFVRLESFIVPKTSLTGANIERVDTRVAQVIYALDPQHRLVREKKVLVGQLVDVFIDTRSSGHTAPTRE